MGRGRSTEWTNSPFKPAEDVPPLEKTEPLTLESGGNHTVPRVVPAGARVTVVESAV